MDKSSLLELLTKSRLQQASHRNAFKNILFICKLPTCSFVLRAELKKNNKEYNIFVSNNVITHNHSITVSFINIIIFGDICFQTFLINFLLMKSHQSFSIYIL